MKRSAFGGIALASLLALAVQAGCRTVSGPFALHSGTRKALAVMQPTAGNEVHGLVTFTQTAGGVQIVADFSGLAPGEHGFHVHEFGDSSSPDGTAAGGHFNPHDAAHSLPNGSMRHVGDLGNLEADAAGSAHYERLDKVIQFHGKSSILGRGVIVHAKSDDGGQPTGNAGARVAMGVIGVAAE